MTDLSSLISRVEEGSELASARCPQEPWQDMASAPKDTPIFLWGYLEVSSHSRPLIGADDRYEAFWDAEAEAWRCYTYEGWIVSPFAWMPLPPPFKGSGSRLADATPKPLPPAPKATP